MPPVNQGSRTALVTWTVVTSILFVTATIMAIYFYVDSDRVNERLTTLEQAYSDVLTRDMLRGQQVEDLRAARQDESSGFTSSMKLLDVALGQRDRLNKLVTGSEDNAAAPTIAQNAIEKAKEIGVNPPTESLQATVDALVAEVQARRTEAENNRKDSEDSKRKLEQTVAATKGQIDALTKAMEQLRMERDEQMREAQRVAQTQTQGFEATAGDMRKQLEAAQEQINTVNAQNAELAALVERQKQEMTELKDKLGLQRVDPNRSIVQVADGTILRVPSADTVIISLGQGSQISPGLTFEVFDKFEGIPPLTEPDDETLPVGKASIEVIRVFSSGAECRVTRRSLGAGPIVEGDLIVNIVYDRNTKYNFLVHGNFDLDQNGNATAQDAEVVKQLITKWGSNITNEINVNTDFVVLGVEPVIPDRPAEPDPIEEARYQQAVAEAEAYDEISRLAREYRIPILNQNKFLYFIGYYEQAKR